MNRTTQRGGARSGAGRPKSENRKQTLGTSVHPEAKAKLAQLADESGHSQAAILEHLIAECDQLPECLLKF